MASVLRLLASRPGFRSLWLGNVVSQLGDWIGWVAVAVLAIHAGGGAWSIALVFAAHHVPAALLTPVSGALTDRYDRRRVLIVVSGLLALVTVAMVVAAAATHIAALQGLLVLRSAATAFFSPAERAALPRVVTREELLLANAIDAATWSVAFSVGMALGGLLTAVGPVLALGIDAATFVVSAAFFARLPALPPLQLAPQIRPSAGGQLGQAARVVARDPQLRRAVFAKAPLALTGGAAWLVLAVNADALLGAAVGFGLLNAIRGIGTGIGPAIVAWHLRDNAAHRRRRLWSSVYLAALGAMAVFSAASVLWLAALAAVVWGIGSGANWVLSAERISSLAPDRWLGRINAMHQFAMIAGQTLGVLGLAAWLGAGGRAAHGVTALAALAALLWWALDSRRGVLGGGIRT